MSFFYKGSIIHLINYSTNPGHPYMSRISELLFVVCLNKSMNLLLICRSFIKVLLFISLIIPPILDIHTCPRISGTIIRCLFKQINEPIVDLSFFYKGSIIHLINYSTNPGHPYMSRIIGTIIRCLFKQINEPIVDLSFFYKGSIINFINYSTNPGHPYMSRISGTIISCLFNKSMNLLLICRSFIKVLLFISLIIPPILDITQSMYVQNEWDYYSLFV